MGGLCGEPFGVSSVIVRRVLHHNGDTRVGRGAVEVFVKWAMAGL